MNFLQAKETCGSIALAVSLCAQPTLAQQVGVHPELPLLDLESCNQTEEGRELLAAIERESEASGDVLVSARQEPDFTLRVTDCSWKNGSVAVNVRSSEQLPTQEHSLNLGEVPAAARKRTAAVALLEWARALPRGPTAAAAPQANPLPSSTPLLAGAGAQPNTRDTVRDQEAPPERELPASPARVRNVVLEVGVGFQLAGEPTPSSLRADTLVEVQLLDHVKASFALQVAHVDVRSRFAKLNCWWWGGEAGLGYAWGEKAELSLWGVAALDGVTMRASNDGESGTQTTPVVSSSLRVKARTQLDSGLTFGAAVDGGVFVQGARFTVLGNTVGEFSGFRWASRLLVGYAF